MAKKEYIEVGTIRLGDYGLYLKLHPCRNKNESGQWVESSYGLKRLAEALNGAENGLNLNITKPADDINRMVDLGFKKPEDAEKEIANIPEWKKYIVKLVI